MKHASIHQERGRLHLVAFGLLIFAVCSISAISWNLPQRMLNADEGSSSTDLSMRAGSIEEKQPTKQRGRRIPDPVTAPQLYEVYQDMHEEYMNKAFRSRNWKSLYKVDDVEISMMELKEDPSCPYVKMEAVIPVPVEDCWNYLSLPNWDKSMTKMDPFYEGVQCYGEYNHKKTNMLLCRKRTKRIFTFGKRDLVFLSVTAPHLPDGTWVSGTVSIDTAKVPRQNGYVRAFQDSVSFYKPVNGNQTAVTILFRLDLNDSSEDGGGGAIPMWLYVKTIGRSGAQSVATMRKALVEDMEERLARGTAGTADAGGAGWWKKSFMGAFALV